MLSVAVKVSVKPSEVCQNWAAVDATQGGAGHLMEAGSLWARLA